MLETLSSSSLLIADGSGVDSSINAHGNSSGSSSGGNSTSGFDSNAGNDDDISAHVAELARTLQALLSHAGAVHMHPAAMMGSWMGSHSGLRDEL